MRALAIVGVALAAIVAKLLIDAGELSALPVAAQTWTCARVVRDLEHSVHALPGLEDAVVYKEYTLFSSDNRDAWMGSREKMATLRASDQGAIFLVREPSARSLKQTPTIERMKLVNFKALDFHPHGLGIWSRGMRPRLFVVNHQRNLCVLKRTRNGHLLFGFRFLYRVLSLCSHASPPYTIHW